MSYSLGSNFGVVICAMLLYILLLDGRLTPKSKRFQFAIGISFGIFSVISMLAPIHVREGVIIDAKYPLAVISATYGGPIAGLITILISGTSRALLGGMGVFAAVPTLIASWGLGLLFRKWSSNTLPIRTRVVHFAILGCTLWVFQLFGGLIFLFFEPWSEVRSILVDRSIPALLIFPPMTILLGAALDFIDSRHRLRKEQFESETRFRQLFDTAPISMAILRGPSWEVLQQNFAFASNLGNSFVDAQAELWKNAWVQIYERGMDYWQDCQHTGSSGVLYLSVHVGKLEFEGVPCLLVNVLDQTQEHMAKLGRARLTASLERRNQELQALNYVLHHDLRTPVVTIQAFLAELREQLQLKNYVGAQKDFHRIENAATKLSRLLLGITQLNEVMRQGPTEGPASCQLRRVLNQLCSQLQIPPDRIVHFGTDMLIPWDGKIISNILFPILENAIRFSRPSVDLRLEFLAQLEGDYFRLSVKDNGMGIAPAFQERVFDLFEQLNPNASGGIGLGLTLAKRIVESLQGRIWAESEGEGYGTCIQIMIPYNLNTHFELVN